MIAWLWRQNKVASLGEMAQYGAGGEPPGRAGFMPFCLGTGNALAGQALSLRGGARPPPDSPRGRPLATSKKKSRTRRSSERPGPSIDLARAGVPPSTSLAFSPQQGWIGAASVMEHSTPKWVPATCVKRLIAEIFVPNWERPH